MLFTSIYIISSGLHCFITSSVFVSVVLMMMMMLRLSP